MTLDQEVQSVKDRVSKAQRDQAGASHAYEVALAQVQGSVTALRDEFGVESMDGAQALLGSLRGELAAECAGVAAALARSEETA